MSFFKLALSSQEQLEGSDSSQDLIDEVEEVPDTSASVKNKFSFRPRIRNPALSGIMSFNVDYEDSAVEESSLGSAVEEFGIGSAENKNFDETPDVYTKDNNDNFSETSAESNEISNDDNDVFEDYSTPDFDVPPESNDTDTFTDDRFM